MIAADTIAIALTYPLAATFFLLLFLLAMRFMQHRERMAMIAQGMVPKTESNSPGRNLQAGLVTAGVGAGLTVGLLTLGVGPWVMAGLIPLFVGLGLVVHHRITPH